MSFKESGVTIWLMAKAVFIASERAQFLMESGSMTSFMAKAFRAGKMEQPNFQVNFTKTKK